jgi:hypothetical protein
MGPLFWGLGHLYPDFPVMDVKRNLQDTLRKRDGNPE